MTGTLARATIIAIPVAALLVMAVIAWIRTRTLASLLVMVGAGCLGVMVFTHVAEALHWLPTMRWGQPNSPGHYVDLTSLVVGLSCLAGGAMIQAKKDRGVNN